jgi:hypothetical protein
MGADRLSCGSMGGSTWDAISSAGGGASISRRRETLGPVIFLLEEEAGALLGSLKLKEET